MQLRKLILTLAVCTVMAAPAAAVTLQYLVNPSGGSQLGNFDVNYDGSRAVANYGGKIYLMDAAGNFTLVNIVAGEGSNCGISGDGHTIVTNMRDEFGVEIGLILRESEGWTANVLPVPDGYLPCDSFGTAAYKVNGDGSKVCGLLWDGCAAKCFLWTEATGMQDLGPTRGSCISQDGTVIGGFNNSYRRPSFWTIEGNIGSSSILLHHPEDVGEVFDITTNGQVLVGTGLPYGFDPILTGYQAFYYEMGDTNFTLLGTLTGSPNDISKALHVADNGMVIGVSGPSSINVTTFVWTPTIGMTSLEQYLMDAGITIPNSMSFNWPRAFSADGSTLIGEYVDFYNGSGNYRIDFGKTSAVGETVSRPSRLTGVSPNPFNPMTTVSFALDRRQQATVSVYDISGRKVAELADQIFEAGDHRIVWRGKDQSGGEAPSGTYIVRLVSGQETDSRTISLIR